MATSIAQLNKLRGRRLREIGIRAQQALAKLGGRRRGLNSKEMSDAALLRQFVTASHNGSGEGAAGLILARLRICASPLPYAPAKWAFLPVLVYRDEVIATMERRFPAERGAIIARAERARVGRFAILDCGDLSFGETPQSIDWHLDPLSGKRAPFAHWSKFDLQDPLGGGNPKIIWELNRHTHFVTLGQAYWLTNDERFVASFIAQASAWMDANPPGMGINWVSSLDVAFRAISWLWALHLCAGSVLLMGDFMARFLKQLIAHGSYIESYLSLSFSSNRCLMGEALGLSYLGSAFPELKRAQLWRHTGMEILLEQLSSQLRNEGNHFEHISYDHRNAMDFYTHLRVLAQERDAQLPSETSDQVARVFDHLMWVMRPDGRSSLFGNDSGERWIKLNERAANDFRDTLATGAALHRRRDWKWVAGEATVETLWLLGPRGLADYDRLTTTPPRTLARAFRDGGYFVIRDGWERESSYVLFDCGKGGPHIGGGDAQADTLSIEFAATGVTWLVDPRNFRRATDRHISEGFRTTASHNTVIVDGDLNSISGSPSTWRCSDNGRIVTSRAGDQGAFVEGWHIGNQLLNDPVTHKRAVLLIKADSEKGLPAYLVVRDLFIARANHCYTFYYHFPVTCRAAMAANQIRAIEPGGGALTLAAFGTSEVRARVTQDLIYGHRAQTAVGVFEAEGAGTQEFLTVIIPCPPEHIVNVERRIIEDWRTQGFLNNSLNSASGDLAYEAPPISTRFKKATD
jgi:hypothetical protein